MGERRDLRGLIVPINRKIKKYLFDVTSDYQPTSVTNGETTSTTDMIFLPRYKDVFDKKGQTKGACVPTDYARVNGAWSNKSREHWLYITKHTIFKLYWCSRR